MDFDWSKGQWRADAAAEEEPEARIVIGADWAPIGEYESRIATGPESAYGDLLPELRRADLRIVNLECALGDAGRKIFKAGPNMGAPADALEGLTAVPFHVACLGNNHTYDFGRERLREMLDLLRGAGIQWLGAGLSEGDAWRPLVVPAGRARVGIVNFCEGEDCTAARDGQSGVAGWDLNRVVANVQDLRSEADVVLVIAHAGREHPPVPPPYIVEAYRRIAEAGAHAVIGHHPHVPQGVEIHGGAPIAYSLGNFVFYDKAPLFFRKSGYVVELQLRGKRLSGMQLIPYRLAPEGLERITGPLLAWFLAELHKASEPLADTARVHDAWAAFIERRKEAGLKEAMNWSLGVFDKEPPLGAARLRNLFVTPAHRHLYVDGLTRIVEGTWGTAPEWAYDLVERWTTLSVESGLQRPA